MVAEAPEAAALLRDPILIVDDEPDVLGAYATLLRESLGVEVLTARNASEAIAALRSRPVGLVLADYRMPGMDGVQLLALCAREWPRVPRVLMTAHPDPLPEAGQDAHLRGGIAAFHHKTAPPGHLLDLVACLTQPT
jgi:DNA-binding NtrC family response regulator